MIDEALLPRGGLPATPGLLAAALVLMLAACRDAGAPYALLREDWEARSRVYCTGGRRSIIVRHQVIGCQP